MVATSAQQAAVQGTGEVTRKRAWTWYRLAEGMTPYLLIAPFLTLFLRRYPI